MKMIASHKVLLPGIVAQYKQHEQIKYCILTMKIMKFGPLPAIQPCFKIAFGESAFGQSFGNPFK